MNFMKRAWLYITRKKGKSMLLFTLLLVMATFVLTALALGNASDAAQMDLRKSLGGSFTVGFDYTDENPYLKVENVDGGTIMYSTQQISPQLVKKIREMDGVISVSASAESLAVFPYLDLFAGNIPIEEAFRQSTKILGTWKSEELSRFTSGQLSLTQGRHITPEDKNKVMISKDLADKNGLKIGDTIQTDSGVNMEIIGLFSPKSTEGINDQVTAYDKIQNLVICDLAAIVAIENSPAILGFNEMTVSVEDPQRMDGIISKVKEIKDVDWKGFSITSDNSGFDDAAASLQQLSGLMSTSLRVVLVVSIVLLSLILTMWARSRIHETGILLSAGIRKLSILGQYMAEVLMIAIFAFSLSYFSSGAAVSQIERIFSSVQAAGEDKKEDGSAAKNGVKAQKSEQNMEIPELDVCVQLGDMGLLFLIGTGVTAVSAGIASVSVMRLKPREILSKMS